MRVLVAISGATGAAFGVRVLEILREQPSIETHLIVSKWGKTNIKIETRRTVDEVESLADHVHQNSDLGAPVSSGSFHIDAMIVAPCSMKTLAAIRYGIADTLIARAADVMLKERRTLCLAVRETPLSPIHLESMLDQARLGVSIAPPLPSFYTAPRTVDDLITYAAVRIIDQIGVRVDNTARWAGIDKHAIMADQTRDATPQSTLMWEAQASATSRKNLVHWVHTTLHPTIIAAQGYPLATYINDDNVIVVIADNLQIDTFAPPSPAAALVAKPPSYWYFAPLTGQFSVTPDPSTCAGLSSATPSRDAAAPQFDPDQPSSTSKDT